MTSFEDHMQVKKKNDVVHIRLQITLSHRLDKKNFVFDLITEGKKKNKQLRF